MKRIKRTLITENVENVSIREKLPIRWWVNPTKTKLSDDWVEVVFNYHPDIGSNKQTCHRFYRLSNQELEAIKLKGDESNPFNKVGMVSALARKAQDKFREEIDRKLLDCYHGQEGLDGTIELFETDSNIDYLLRGYALYEAKLAKMNASAR